MFQGFNEPSVDDNILEVVAVLGAHQMVWLYRYLISDSLVYPGKHLLEVPNVRLKSYGDRAFSVAAPKQWNDIPLDIKLSGSVDVFKSRLKTYLFRLAFI